MPRDPWASSYGNGPAEPGPAPQRYPSIPAQRGASASSPPDDQHPPPPAGYADRPDPEQPPRGPRGGQGPLIIALVIMLGGGALAAVLLLRGSDRPPGLATAPAAAPAAPHSAGEVRVPSEPTGTATLSDPTITTVKAPLPAARRWCSLLTADDVRAATGFEQRGSPDSTLLCTHYLADGAGHLFVSDIPAAEGAAYTLRGNSAIVYQSNPTACEVTVALNRGGGVLDIDVRNIVSPRVPLCQAAANLAARAFDRLPAG